MSDIEKNIRNIINEKLSNDIYKNSDDIIRTENLFNIGLDSLNIVGFMMAIEDKYNIIFEDNEIGFENWKTIESIENLIKTKI